MNYYDIGMKSMLFNRKVFWLYFLNSTVQSLIITFFCIQTIELNFDSTSGRSLTFWTIGVMILGMVVMISNFKVLIIATEYSIGLISVIMLSVMLYTIALAMSTNI